MYAVKHDQCKKSKDEIFTKLQACCICNLIPIPFIRDRNMTEKVYCTKCAIKNNITNGRLSNEDKSYLEQLIIECRRYCGETFTYNTIEDLIEHENECDYTSYQPKNICVVCRKKLNGTKHDCLLNTNRRITSIENSINDNFQTINESNEERFSNLENNQEILKTHINQLSELIKTYGIKKDLDFQFSDEAKVNSTEKPSKLNFDEINEQIKLSIGINNEKIKSNLENELKNYMNLKFSEFDKSSNQRDSNVSIIQTDLFTLKNNLMMYLQDINEKINNFSKKIQNLETNSKSGNLICGETKDEKILIDSEYIKIESKSESNKDQKIFELESNLNKLKLMKMNSDEKYKYMIHSDSLIDITKLFDIQELKLIQDPSVFKNKFKRIENGNFHL